MTNNLFAIKDKCEWFLNERKWFFMTVIVCILGLIISSKPITLSVLLCTFLLVLLFLFPELGLFLFITLFPFHIVIVCLLGLAPKGWKELLLISSVILWISKGIVSRKSFLTKTKVDFPLYLFIFWCFLLFLMDNGNFQASIVGLCNLLQYILVFILVINLIKDKAGIKKYILVILVSAVIIAAVNIFLFFFEPDFFNRISIIVNPKFPIAGMDRLSPATFMGTENYAHYMTLICCLFIGFFLYARPGLLKVMLLAGSCLLAFSLILTGTRGGILSLLVAIMFFGSLYNRKLIFAVIILAFIIAIFLPPLLYERLITGFFVYNTADRFFMVRNALAVAGTSPIWGIGISNIGTAAAEANQLSTPHNYYCYLILQIGFVGLIIYLWIMAIFIKTSLKVYERMENDYWKGFMASMILFFIAFSVSSLFLGSGESFLLAPFYWFFGGLVMVLEKETAQKQYINYRK